MEKLVLPANSSGMVELDLCYACQGIWVDPQENLKLSPAGVAELFRGMHAGRGVARQALSSKLNCPRCNGTLNQGFDLVRSGRYITYRCSRRHGRFSTFSSFMVEKGWVRLLTEAEIQDIARKVAVIHCGSCGAPVDIRQDRACPHCQSALSFMDVQAVDQALQRSTNSTGASSSASSSASSPPGPAADLADALAKLERDRQDSQHQPSSELDLWSLGISMVGSLLGLTKR